MHLSLLPSKREILPIGYDGNIEMIELNESFPDPHSDSVHINGFRMSLKAPELTHPWRRSSATILVNARSLEPSKPPRSVQITTRKEYDKRWPT